MTLSTSRSVSTPPPAVYPTAKPTCEISSTISAICIAQPSSNIITPAPWPKSPSPVTGQAEPESSRHPTYQRVDFFSPTPSDFRIIGTCQRLLEQATELGTEATVEVWAVDEHRIGLKPLL